MFVFGDAAAASAAAASAAAPTTTTATGAAAAAVSKPKRARRTKAEIEAYLAQHSGKRKVTSEEMSLFLELRSRRKGVVGGAGAGASAGPSASVINRKKAKFPSSQGGQKPSSFVQTQHCYPALMKRELEIWKGVCKILNCYDLEGLQDWLGDFCSPHMMMRFIGSNFAPIFGPKALALYFCATLGCFPVYNAHRERILELDPFTHSTLLDEAKSSSSLLANSLSLENTIGYRFVAQFEGVRIYYQDLWDIMGTYVAKHPEMLRLGPASELLLKGTEVHDMLLGTDDAGIYSDITRIPPSDLRVRNDGLTVVEVEFRLLAESASGAFISCTIQIFTQLCPALDAIRGDLAPAARQPGDRD